MAADQYYKIDSNVQDIDEIFSRAIDEDEEERQRREGVRIARRLVTAFILIMVTGAVCWVVLPQFGMRLPPLAVIAIFGFMAFASLATLFENRPRKPRSMKDDARPISCCGLRPVGEMSRKRADDLSGPGGSCGCG
jgi:hypothetical protein